MVVDKKEIGTVLPHPLDVTATSGRVQAFDLLTSFLRLGDASRLATSTDCSG
jgi:hypothetical protein